ncbi:MAG: hypothetical protein Q7N50_01350 [Armatimonadota bacterium]|nr:hypothetical protein [Armatimonadota bacterium]
MTDEIVVLAVTKMLSGMCIGGISLSTGEWVRPIKEFGTILPGDLAYVDGAPIRPFDVVEFSLAKHRPKAPHIEDWVCDFIRERPVLARRLEEREREAFLQKHAEPGGYEEITNQKRSLCLLDSQEAQALFSLDAYSGKYQARLYFPALGRQRAVPVTDIKWRALGRRLIGDGGRVKLSAEQLREITGARSIYPAIGLSRQYEGKFWPLIVGVHCLPDYEAEVDYRNL